MINGENFLHPFILRLGCGQFLLCLEHIALRSYARNIHVLSRIHGTPGGKHLLGSIFLLFLIVGHFPATDYGQNLTFLHIISRFRMDFRHRPPNMGYTRATCSWLKVTRPFRVSSIVTSCILTVSMVTTCFKLSVRKIPHWSCLFVQPVPNSYKEEEKISPVKDIMIHCCSLIDKLLIIKYILSDNAVQILHSQKQVLTCVI